MPQPKTIKERDVLIECKALLDFFKHKGVLDYWRINNGPKMRCGFKTKNTEMAGFSDTIILTLEPRVIFLEFKATDGKQSEEQKIFQKRVEAMGHKYHLCKNRSELCEILKQSGIHMTLFSE